MTATRRLAAIMAVDVVGYSRLMGEDEAGTALAVREHREAALPLVAVKGGRIVKTMGDGLLLEFPSVVAAVECAAAIQSLMVERNADAPEAKRIVYRIGVNLGDVLIEGDDILGEGVNIAARLEAICAPGGVLISSTAHDHVRGKINAEFVDLGEKTLKNIAQPVRVYSLQVGMPAVARPAIQAKPPESTKRSMPAPLTAGIVVLIVLFGVAGYFLSGSHPAPAVVTRPPPAHLSIVVLPFTNLSNDPAQDYFADGVTENLTTDLSRIRDSFVIARNTAFTYKGKAVDAKEIGKELGVRYVLEGSVQRDQNRVRVNAQLIDAETGAHLWADRFEEDIVDLFKLQDQVVARLTNSLGYELIKAEARKGERIGNLDAFDLTMRARALTFQYDQQPTKENNDAARAGYEQALKINPDDPEALVGDASTYMIEKALGWADPNTDYEDKVLGQVDRSIALARDDPRPYIVKSYYLINAHRPEDGLRAADAGLAINPNSASLRSVRGYAEISMGQFEQGKPDLQLAVRLSPHDPNLGVWRTTLCLAELGLAHFDRAIDECNLAVDAGYHLFHAFSFLAAAHALKGDMPEAKTALAEARRLSPKLSVNFMAARYPNNPTLLDGLRKSGLPE